MKHFRTACVSIFTLLLLTACQDYSSPLGVTKTLGDAIHRNDSVAARHSLTGEALRDYGDEAGFAELHSEFDRRSQFEISRAILLESSADGTRDTYAVRVTGEGRESARIEWSLEIECFTDRTPTTDNSYAPCAPGYYYPHCEAQALPLYRIPMRGCLISKLTRNS